MPHRFPDRGQGLSLQPPRSVRSAFRRGCADLEAFAGPDQLKGLTLTGGELLPIEKPTRRLEVIGDSISCGYGDEGAKTIARAIADEAVRRHLLQ